MGHKWLKPCSLTNLPLVLETMYPLNWQLEQYYSKGSAAFRAVERRVSCDLKSDLTPLYPVPSPPPLMVTQAKGSLVLFCTPSFLAMPALRHGRCMARDLQHQRRNHMSKCLPFPALRDHVANIMKGYLLRTPWGKERLWPFHFCDHRAYNIPGVGVCVCACSCDELQSYLFSVWHSKYYFWLHFDLPITRKLSDPCPSYARTTSQNTSPPFFFFSFF